MNTDNTNTDNTNNEHLLMLAVRPPSEQKTREFSARTVLSAVTGVLLSPDGMSGLYDIFSFMAGRQVFTHELVPCLRAYGWVISIQAGIHDDTLVKRFAKMTVEERMEFGLDEFVNRIESAYGSSFNICNGLSKVTANPIETLLAQTSADRVVAVVVEP